MFGIKDLFTIINLLGGIVAMCLCVDGQPYWAGIAILVGYLCGDTLDGYVARKLGTANQFGGEFDTIADHLSHVIAPAVIVYTVYRDKALLPGRWNQVLAIALGLASAFCYAGNVFCVRRLAARIGPARAMSSHSLLAAALLAPGLAVGVGGLATVTASDLALLSAGAATIGAASGIVFVIGLQRIGSARAAVLTFAEPLVAVLVGVLAWHESLSPVAAAGGVLVVGAGIHVARQAR